MSNTTRTTAPTTGDLRLRTLESFNILDTPPEQAFDDIVEAASAFCSTPIALVSLVDADRQWFKACLGLNVSQTPVDQAVCAIAIRQADPLVIPDLALDPRTAANPLVTVSPRIRFYAGAQLVTKSGQALGTLCVIDYEPRAEGLSQAQLRGLVALARQATHLIEMRNAVEERDASIADHIRDGEEAHDRAATSERARLLAEERDGRSTAAQEAGRVGTFELDVVTGIAQVSAEFCRLYGLPETASVPATDIEALALVDSEVLHSNAAERANGSAKLDVEYRIRRPIDGRIRWIARRARFERDADGRVVRMFGTVHDITERRLSSARVVALLELGDYLRQADSLSDTVSMASRILGRELATDRVGYATVDRTAGTFHIECDWTAKGVASLVGTHPLSGVAVTLGLLASGQTMAIENVSDALELGVDREAYDVFGAKALINFPLVVRGELVGVLFAHSATPRSWSEAEIEFAHGVADRAYATIAQLAAEDHRNVLNLELSHRMKNMLAMVQAISNQTLKDVTERDAVAALNERLMALSSAHDVLLQDNWAAAPVANVVERVLETLGVVERVRFSGTPVELGPRAALALSLLLHELSTNAIKYGSLTAPDGHVDLTWRIEGVGAEAKFKIDWREVGGPQAQEPARKGFGSRLIKMGLLGTGGTVTNYLPSGFEAEFSASLDRAKAE